MYKGCRGDVQGLPGRCAKVAGEMCNGDKLKSTPSPRSKTGVWQLLNQEPYLAKAVWRVKWHWTSFESQLAILSQLVGHFEISAHNEAVNVSHICWLENLYWVQSRLIWPYRKFIKMRFRCFHTVCNSIWLLLHSYDILTWIVNRKYQYSTYWTKFYTVNYQSHKGRRKVPNMAAQ